MMLVRAADLGVTGREKPVALDANANLLERLEALRIDAGAHLLGCRDFCPRAFRSAIFASSSAARAAARWASSGPA